MRLRYAGPGPQEDGDGGIAYPGEVRDFDKEPAWGPWEPVPDEDGGEAPEQPQSVPATQPPTGGAARPAAASPATQPPVSAPAADDGKGM